jgi:hypothetical protein
MGLRKYGYLIDAETDDDGDLRYRATGTAGGTEER